MERELFNLLHKNLQLAIKNETFKLSNDFKILHTSFIQLHDKTKYFQLKETIPKNIRKDQLFLNLQYSNLVKNFSFYDPIEYYHSVEEFLTYTLNYEIITGRCLTNFINIITILLQTIGIYRKQLLLLVFQQERSN